MPAQNLTDWVEDTELGAGYLQHTFDLGTDPDEEGVGSAVATLIKKATPPKGRAVRGAVLHVHGFTDYFFQTELADFFTDRGFAFYALDLRKCGRSRRRGQTPHYVSDLAHYDNELGKALDVIRSEVDGPVVLEGHSTGGLILPLWLNRLAQRPGGVVGQGIAGLILNSPWFDLQGAAWMRTVGTQAFRAIAKVRPLEPIKLPPSTVYGDSLAASQSGEWSYNLEYKPLGGCAVTYGWITAIRRGHAQLHRGLDVQVPSLVLRSTRTWYGKEFGPQAVGADTVLDVKQIARWSGCLGDHTWVVPIDGAKHDVFLSPKQARDEAYATVDLWLKDRGLL